MESKSKVLTLKKATFPYIDDAVYSWFTFARSKSFPVDQDLLSTKAIEFKEKFLQKLKDSDEIKRLEGLKASSGWIKNFKKRFKYIQDIYTEKVGLLIQKKSRIIDAKN